MTVNRAFYLVAPLLVASCSDSSSKSPEFDPETDITVSGRFLNIDGSGLADTRLDFQNLRRQGYIDYQQVAKDALAFALATPYLFAAWPFIWFYNFTKTKLEDYEESPDFFVSELSTSFDGTFRFVAKAGNLLRDADGGINITVVNGKSSVESFGKFSFVVQSADTDLGSVTLCDLGGIGTTEGANSVDLTWTSPSFNVDHYVINFADTEDNSLIWSSRVAGTETSHSLPKAALPKATARVAIEAFQTVGEFQVVSCLTPTVELALASPPTNLAQGAVISGDAIDFRITSLTNGSFSDNPYLGAFGLSEFSLDLGQVQSINEILLHNLQLASAANLVVGLSVDGSNWTSLDPVESTRFKQISLSPAQTARYVRIRFEANIESLQELVLQ